MTSLFSGHITLYVGIKQKEASCNLLQKINQLIEWDSLVIRVHLDAYSPPQGEKGKQNVK